MGILTQGLRRFFQTELQVDILTDVNFNLINQIFKAVLKTLKKEGFGKITHCPAINEFDLLKIKCYYCSYSIAVSHVILYSILFL